MTGTESVIVVVKLLLEVQVTSILPIIGNYYNDTENFLVVYSSKLERLKVRGMDVLSVLSSTDVEVKTMLSLFYTLYFCGTLDDIRA